nr:MAG TPA: hypothetical protein [Caudoviricetes sp.]
MQDLSYCDNILLICIIMKCQVQAQNIQADHRRSTY